MTVIQLPRSHSNSGVLNRIENGADAVFKTTSSIAFSFLTNLAPFVTPLGPAFFFGHSLYKTVQELTGSLWVSGLVGFVGALALESAGIMSSHVAIRLYEAGKTKKALLASLIVIIYLSVGITGIWLFEDTGWDAKVAGTILFIVTLCVYLVLALVTEQSEQQAIKVVKQQNDHELEIRKSNNEFELQRLEMENKQRLLEQELQMKKQLASERIEARTKVKLAETTILPAESKSLPVENGRLPVESQSLPVEDGRLPVASQFLPAENGKLPVEKFPCEYGCDKSFDKKVSRAGHYKTCPNHPNRKKEVIATV